MPKWQQSILKPISEIEAQYEVHALEAQYPHKRRVYIPRVPYKKLISGMELRENKNKRSISQSEVNRENIDRSIRRTRTKIRDLVLCNDFDWFVTLTIKSDRQNDTRSKIKIVNWFKNQKKRNGKFEHLTVPEKHKDGAFHFHSLLKNYSGEFQEAINPKTGKQVVINGREIFNLVGYKLGFSDARQIDKTIESREKIGYYVSKYLTKDMPAQFGKNRYWASHGLKRPTYIENPTEWYLSETPDNRIENEFGIILDFLNKPGNLHG